MLDLTKPMASKNNGKVVHFYVIPQEFQCWQPLIVVFEESRDPWYFTLDGHYWLHKTDENEDLYNIEE